jgi:hypothetical protein
MPLLSVSVEQPVTIAQAHRVRVTTSTLVTEPEKRVTGASARCRKTDGMGRLSIERRCRQFEPFQCQSFNHLYEIISACAGFSGRQQSLSDEKQEKCLPTVTIGFILK